MAAQKYSQFSLRLVENRGRQELVDAFCTFLADKYTAGHYPSPPVAHIWEEDTHRRYVPSSSSDRRGDSSSSDSSSSSVELAEGGVDLGVGWPADVVDGVRLMQGDYHVPSVFALLDGGEASVEAGVPAHGNTDDVATDSSDPLIENDDKIDMEPLF